MKAILILSSVIVSVCPALAVSVPVSDDWSCVQSLSNFQDIDIKEGVFRLNNFSLSEGPASFGSTPTGIKFTYSITNRGNSTMHLDLQLAAFDADRKLLFVARSAPMMDMVRANSTTTGTGITFSNGEMLSRAETFCLVVNGS